MKKKIEKLLTNKRDLFNAIEVGGEKDIKQVSKEEAEGTYYLTNGISKSNKEYALFTESFEDSGGFIYNQRGKISIYDEDSKYYLNINTASSKKVKILDKNNELVCIVALDKHDNYVLLKNNTPYTLLNYPDGSIRIYSKDYIDSLDGNEPIKADYMLADIEWALCDKNARAGFAKVCLYEKADFESDFEIIALFALSTFILFKKEHDAAVRTMMASAALANSASM